MALLVGDYVWGPINLMLFIFSCRYGDVGWVCIFEDYCCIPNGVACSKYYILSISMVHKHVINLVLGLVILTTLLALSPPFVVPYYFKS